MPDLPQRPREDRTVGTVFTAPDGKRFQPSMFVTLTSTATERCARRGVPVRPDRRYDYRRAALDALHFAKLMDRWFQNLRRCAGYRVQHFGAIEAQMRLAPHFHVALRGAIPRATLKAVTAATYVALWWPQMDTVVYEHRTPLWDDGHYRDPDTGYPLTTWEQALDDIDDDPDAPPAHVVTFGRQVDVKGVLGSSKDSDRAVRYLTKYLTKSVADTYTDGDAPDPTYEAHMDRLHHEIRWLPCSPECANWLRVRRPAEEPRARTGPRPLRLQGARPGAPRPRRPTRPCVEGLVRQDPQHAPGRPASRRRASARGGRHRARGRRPYGRRVLTDDGKPRFVWEEVPVTQADWAHVVMQSMLDRRRRKAQYEQAKSLLVGADPPPVDNRSANATPSRAQCA